MLSLSTPIAEIPGIGPRFGSKLKRLGIVSIQDLLYHFPSRYEDFSQVYPIGDLEPGQQTTIQGTIKSVDMRRTWQRKMVIVEAHIEDETGEIRAVWFNQPYVKNSLRPGQLANFSGKVGIMEGELYLSNPGYEIVGGRREETRHTARLVPIYPETRGLTSKGLRFLIQPILKVIPEITEWIPDSVLESQGFPEINEAIHNVHFPKALEEAQAAKKRFAFEDLFLLQLYNLTQRAALRKEKAPQMKIDLEDTKKILAELPFELTQSQKRSLWEVIQCLEKGEPMNRLLQGDVGSGKTVIAALSAILTSANGHQAAFMTPTEVLARQHYETMKKLCGSIKEIHQPVLALLTGSEAKLFYENDLEADIKKADLKKKIAQGEVQIVFGTHALIQKDTEWQSLGLVVIDEQHRFGVEQRATLAKTKEHGKKGRKKNILLPHFLSMSATPIPRTLMLTIFGDLDLSVINELPKGRKEITTKIVAKENRAKAYAFIREQIKKGRQAFVVCPRIEPSETNEQNKKGSNYVDPKTAKLWEVRSVKEEFEKLSKKIFPDLKVAMLHGQMKPKEKQEIMDTFKKNKIQVLVSTSVIEVGVDVPNATIMMIEGSDRFGLAQLYQFRGRVGRGEHQSYCFLFTDSESKSTSDRLKAIATAKNGFELAEIDLNLRGPGEFIGQKQTGLPDTAMSGLQNVELIKKSREAAQVLFEKDPNLKNYPNLKEKVEEFRKKLHLE